jgi:pSer/pThr/pTyr-binding forkhead associated (FHA) protein
MSQTNGDFIPGSTQTTPGEFNHAEAGLAEILQSACTARHTGQITFRSFASYGYVFLQQGQLLHAVCGTVEGDEAVYQMLGWPPGQYTLSADILPHHRTITSTWEQLLLEGASRADAGMVSPANVEPVTTANPTTAMRAKDSQPKLIITRGDEPPATVELHHEYTYLGRAEGNELPIPEPSISSRHCVFILSGSDVIVRDLNSSNGTYVNGEPVPEAVLRPGDNIQVGVIDIKFVPGVRRPKLSPVAATSTMKAKPRLISTSAQIAASTTLKLPESYQRHREPLSTIDDSQKDKAFVSGSSPISYEQLAPEAPPAETGRGRIIVLVSLILLVILGAVVYFLVFLKH